MPTVVFGSPNKQGDWSASFSSPAKILTAASLDEVIPVISAADEEARKGNYVALMLSYECAPAFDSALLTHTATSFPLVWAAVFSSEQSLDLKVAEVSPVEWSSAVSRNEYNEAIKKIHDFITRGDTYQVNYTFPMVASLTGDALSTYYDLHQAQGAKYSAFLNLGRYKVLSLSPELFFERKGDWVRTKPMKGTVRRGRWPKEDLELANWLANSSKDQAENVMIVDLLRNDLGKVSVPGSVQVSSLFHVERFNTVWQLTSTVESRLREGTNLVELMGALFPCGSITGAPKIRTMEIIRELERYPRGAYTGAIGLLRPGGDCTFNVAIRTIVIDSETNDATFGVGGGITIDSTAEREYDECLVKAKFLTTKNKSFDLFESILLEDGEVFLLERHLARLKSSADFFGFEVELEKARSIMDEIRTSHSKGFWKIKITLSRDGTLTSNAIQIEGHTKQLQVYLASSPVNSSDRLLYHKTTNRNFYNSQLKAQPNADDLIFFNEKGEVTESSIANLVVELEGQRVTPPISAGLLAGTFRDQLIAEGEIVERRITIEELKIVKEFYLINSVRKWMRAVLV